MDIDEVIEDFVDGFLYSNSNAQEEHLDIIKNFFTDIIKDILNNSDSLEGDCIKLSKLNIYNEVPFTVLMSELNYLKKIFLSVFIENSAIQEMLLLHEIYIKIEKYVAKQYLDEYLKKLSKNNIVRLHSLHHLIGMEFINYYEQHIVWLNSLVESIRCLDKDKMPELESSLCVFGYWLLNNAKDIIKTDSEHKNLLNRHERLHNIARLILKQLNKNEDEIDYHILMTYMESSELISLFIGTELALLDNCHMIQKTKKDKVSGAIKSDSLNMLFTNQYELSLATNSSFILAICDLDNCKNIHDTYGDSSSDRLLKEFVNIAKNVLRNSDIIMRYDTEKFIIILLNSDYHAADKKFNELRMVLENFSLNYQEKTLKTTLSVGYVEIKPPNDISDDGINVMRYVKSAERKLLEAQMDGENQVV